jgi:hypothetical protein
MTRRKKIPTDMPVASGKTRPAKIGRLSKMSTLSDPANVQSLEFTANHGETLAERLGAVQKIAEASLIDLVYLAARSSQKDTREAAIFHLDFLHLRDVAVEAEYADVGLLALAKMKEQREQRAGEYLVSLKHIREFAKMDQVRDQANTLIKELYLEQQR